MCPWVNHLAFVTMFSFSEDQYEHTLQACRHRGSESSVSLLDILWIYRASRCWDTDCCFILSCFFPVLSGFFQCVKLELFLSLYFHRVVCLQDAFGFASTEWGSGVTLWCLPRGKLQASCFSPSVLVLGVLLSFCLPGLSIPSGECAAGFYCKGGATLPNPRDDVTGNICPAGTYCSKYPTSIRNKNFISHNIWNTGVSFWECGGQLARVWPECPESQIHLWPVLWKW